MKPRHVRLLFLSLLALGCDESLEPGSKVDSFRVLAEQAEPPYAEPGEVVHLNSLSHDPEGRPITWAWARCLNPTQNGLAGCLAQIGQSSDPASSLLGLGEGLDAIDVQVPSDALATLTGAARAAAGLGVVSIACPGELSFDLEQAAGGQAFDCRDRESGRSLGLDEFSVGLKRIPIHAQDRNQNPTIQSLTFDGAEWPADEVKEVGSCDTSDFDYAACPDQDKHRIAVVLTPESFETGTDEQGHDFSEALIVQYFAMEGIFEDEIRVATSSDNGWVARRVASGRTLTLWFVGRDDRGGVTWTERRIHVR